MPDRPAPCRPCQEGTSLRTVRCFPIAQRSCYGWFLRTGMVPSNGTTANVFHFRCAGYREGSDAADLGDIRENDVGHRAKIHFRIAGRISIVVQVVKDSVEGPAVDSE